MSFVMRGAGVGEGDGVGVGVAVCASAFSGALETASPAAPAAGRSLTKVRRSNFVLVVLSRPVRFLIWSPRDWKFQLLEIKSHLTIVPPPAPAMLGVPYFILTSFALPVRTTVSR